MLLLAVLSQQSKQKAQSSLPATCNLFSVDQLQPRRDGREGRESRGHQYLEDKGCKGFKKKKKRKSKKKMF